MTQIDTSIQLLEDKIQESNCVIDSCEQVSLEIGSFAIILKHNYKVKSFSFVRNFSLRIYP